LEVWIKFPSNLVDDQKMQPNNTSYCRNWFSGSSHKYRFRGMDHFYCCTL